MAMRGGSRARYVTVRTLWACALAIVLADVARFALVDRSSVRSGVLDEISHFATGLLVLGALRSPLRRPFSTGLLAASVLIDLDHVPLYLGASWLTAGAPRPYPHSLLTLVVVGVIAAASSGRVRSFSIGALVGLIAHFARDTAEPSSGVALLWPVSYHTVSIPYFIYAAAMGALLAVGIWRARSAASQSPRPGVEAVGGAHGRRGYAPATWG